MKKKIILKIALLGGFGLVNNAGEQSFNSPFNNSLNNPEANNGFNGMPGGNQPATGSMGNSAISSKPAAAPSWMNTSPWFGDSTNTVTLGSALGDSKWDTIDAQGSSPGAPDATPDPFTVPDEDIPAGP